MSVDIMQRACIMQPSSSFSHSNRRMCLCGSVRVRSIEMRSMPAEEKKTPKIGCRYLRSHYHYSAPCMAQPFTKSTDFVTKSACSRGSFNKVRCSKTPAIASLAHQEARFFRYIDDCAVEENMICPIILPNTDTRVYRCGKVFFILSIVIWR